LVGILSFSLLGCNKEENKPNLTPKEIKLTAHAPQVIAGSNEFGLELFTKVAVDDETNLMLSPLSASAALTMVLNGCNGDTYSQLKETLKYPQDLGIEDINEAYKSLVNQLLEADPKVTIAIANAIFYRFGFDIKQAFLNTMENDFGAHIEGLDFSSSSALNTINGWASDNTNGKIPKVLDEISADAVMFLMNALYFKGNWSYQFDKNQTTNLPFYLDDGSSVEVSTMIGKPAARQYLTDSFSAIELPYGRTNFNMVVIVPQGSLSELYSSLTKETWDQITASLDGQTEGVESLVYMPKFKFSYEKFLNDQLQSMGMVDAFIPYIADFSGITDDEIFISFVKQNTFVEVNEEGTEAAAVTTVGFEVTSANPNEFIVNKPFVFAIRERMTNTILFIGKVSNPLL
jgi:serpin B